MAAGFCLQLGTFVQLSLSVRPVAPTVPSRHMIAAAAVGSVNDLCAKTRF